MSNPSPAPSGALTQTGQVEKFEALESRLRQLEDQGGFDGYEPDKLHVAAADAIKNLRDCSATNWSLYEAWRKRAEEAEAREVALAATTRLCMACDQGTVAPTNIHGRKIGGVVIDDDIVVPVCNSCGEMYVRGDAAKRIDEAIAKTRRPLLPLAIYCTCAAVTPTMPVYRTEHLPTCPVSAFLALTTELHRVREEAKVKTPALSGAIEWAMQHDPQIASDAHLELSALTAEVERLKEELNQTEDVLVGEVQKRMAVERRHEASDHSLSWALDMIDRYDDEMIRRGDDPRLVLSRVHREAKRRARDLLGNPPSDDRRDDYIGADPSQSPPARGNDE